MTRIIKFSRLRFIAPILSLILIGIGIAGLFMGEGLNIGIDFNAGMMMRVQVAPIVMQVAYTGDGIASLNVRGDLLSIEIEKDEETSEDYEFLFADYGTLADMLQAINGVAGIGASLTDDGNIATARLLVLNDAVELSADPFDVNAAVPGKGTPIEIGGVRAALQELGGPLIQVVGDVEDQEFIIRVEEEEGARDFDQQLASNVKQLLEEEFGFGTVKVRQTDYVGARFSQNLIQQSIYLSILALSLILIYIWFRFRLAYAVSAITALIHDALIMFGFIAIFRVEVSTAIVAAVLTIIGYSLNDTIVIFDRVRENTGILRNADFKVITDTSVSQSLSRTLMTSLTTLLVVIALFIFGTGTIRDFALAMIVGITVGTYSSIFIASPMLIGWINSVSKRKKVKEEEIYGARIAEEQQDMPNADRGEQNGGTKPAADIPMAERKLKGKRRKKK